MVLKCMFVGINSPFLSPKNSVRVYLILSVSNILSLTWYSINIH